MGIEERQAIARLREGDIGGLEMLVRQHQARALEVAFLTGGDYPLAEDVVQESFLRAFERIHQFDPTRPFAPWFFRIVINETLKAVRRRKSFSLDEESNAWSAVLADELGDVEIIIAKVETKEEIWAALERLKPRHRAILVARYYLDMTDGDVAAQFNINKGTVRWYLATARQRLRHLLAPWVSMAASDKR